MPGEQPKRGRLLFKGGSCIPPRSDRPEHVWSHNFVADRNHDGKVLRVSCFIDELRSKSLAARVARKLKATDVIDALCEHFGLPAFLRT